MTADDFMGLGIVTDAQRPQPSRPDLRARERADERAREARMRHQHAHPPRARRRHYG